MTARKRPPVERKAQETIDTMLEARQRFVALEAARGWAGRIVLAAVVGDREDVVRDALNFLIARFFEGKRLDDQRDKLRKAIEKQAPDFAPFIDRLLNDRMAAVSEAALMLGVAVGQQTRLTVDEIKAARVQLMLDSGDVRAEVEEHQRALGPAPYDWQCDKGGVRRPG
jgi:hypothetical protein